MNERVKIYLEDFEKTVENLKYAVKVAEDELEIDGAIKRSELCYELSWKLIKAYLEDLGISCKSPREYFKQAKINGVIKDDFLWMKMIEDRNLLAHTYTPEESRKLFEIIKNEYINLLIGFYEKIKEQVL